MKYFLTFVVILFFITCNKESTFSNTEYYNVQQQLKYSIKTMIKGVIIDTIIVDNDIESSFRGFFKVHEDTIYYADELFNYVFRFNKDGSLIDKNLGKGFLDNEIKGFNDVLFYGGNQCYINELTSEISIFDDNFFKLSEYKIDWQINRSKEKALNNPDPKKGDTYEFDFGIPENFKVWDEKHFAIAITTSHPNFNGYYNSGDYYKKSRIIALVNIQSGKVVKLLGRRSPELLNYQYLPNFDHFNYEVFDNSFYVNFWCDSLIYEVDKESKRPIDKFGFKGRDIKNDYVQTQNYPTAKDRWRIDQKEFGYYTYLKFIKEKELLIRGYNKGDTLKVSGLQIYKNKNLIGDVNVPFGLKIIGV